jgi:hypothetical protein
MEAEMDKITSVNLTESDLKVIEAALKFLRANVDDYNELRMEFEEPTLTEEEVNRVYEDLF